ncbi:ferredoxin [Kibdelosporangium philippinense]|uniref:Ferredoxin n=2 Tax=Kibdelosporangium philippinense TaxID=211113 RepID=A0ABS8ZD36_9PSEU|nr:ferredoxin [Kibdelosporangium philippinense]MCE7005432.1 ferredoxin [Kibdelosporangium philippinense]
MSAPRHVMYDDDYGQEFIYRQPQNVEEVKQVLDAAWDDPWTGYAADGDNHWTPATVREWWADRRRLSEWATGLLSNWSISANEDEREAATGARDLLAYLDNGMAAYLRGYVFWLSEGREPVADDTLPEL